MTATQQFIAQAAISIATIIGSGLVSSIVTVRLNNRHDDRNVQRQKLEQLLLAVNRYVVRLVNHFAIYEHCAEGAYNCNDALDLDLKEGAADERSYETAEMLIAIYFPSLQSHLGQIIKCRDVAAEAIDEFKSGYKAGKFTSDPVAIGLKRLNGMLCDAEDDFKKAVHGIARSLDK